jgi:hypothetical protein
MRMRRPKIKKLKELYLRAQAGKDMKKDYDRGVANGVGQSLSIMCPTEDFPKIEKPKRTRKTTKKSK